MGKVVTAMIIALAVSICGESSGAMWYVDGSVPKAGDGSSWHRALKGIQSGIDKAGDGDTVTVARGTYVENVNFNGKNIVLRSMDPTDWNVVKETVIDGNQSGSVVTLAGTEDETCLLAGFTIRNGTGTVVPDNDLNGGGICGTTDLATLPRLTIRNNIITGNSADYGGGIMGCAGVIENCIITGNSAGDTFPNCFGGGIAFCNGIIQNNLIAGNVGLWGGGICYCNAEFRNNVVVGNAAPGGRGGGLAYVGTSAYTTPPGGSITNCIIWGNISPTDPQVHGSVAPRHCCIQDWTGGGDGNISLNPQFVDADGPDDDPSTFEDNDYRLSPASPCIDAGTNEDWMQQAVDLNGNPRIWVGASSLIVDIGAYEYKFAIGGLTRQPEGTVELTWDSRAGTRYTIWSCMGLAPEAWTEEGTILPKESLATWTDADPAAPRKFYRIELK